MKPFSEILAVDSMATVVATSEQLHYIRQKLTICSTSKKKPFIVRLWEEGNVAGTIRVPRSSASVIAENHEIVDLPQWIGIRGEDRATPSLRPEQKQIIDTFLHRIETQAPYGGIIKSPTGTGKTVMGIALAYALGKRTLIVVPTEYLMDQWVRRLVGPPDKPGLPVWTDLKVSDIGIVRQGRCDFQDKPFTIAMLHSLVKREDYPTLMRNYFGTVIIDEVHTISAETFSRVAPMFHSKYRVGLSATPRRKDGMAAVFFGHIGPIISSYGGYVAVPRVRPILYNGDDTNEANIPGQKAVWWGGELVYSRYLNRVSASLGRCRMIARIIAELYKRDGRTLLLSDRILQITSIKNLLMSDHGIAAKDIGIFAGTNKQADRKIILGTYGKAGLGADLPDITSLVLATPRVDIVQAVGRALRKGTPTIVDIVDGKSKTMLGWWYARRKFYRTLTTDLKEPVCLR